MPTQERIAWDVIARCQACGRGYVTFHPRGDRDWIPCLACGWLVKCLLKKERDA